MADNIRTENDALIELAERAQARLEPIVEGRLLHGVVALDQQHVHFDLEPWLERPSRKCERVELHTSVSLADYVVRHTVPPQPGSMKDALGFPDPEQPSTLYADFEKGVIAAILNDSVREEAGWGDHRARLALRKTDAWKLWESHDNDLMSQHDFAEHIEAGLQEIVQPPAAEMLELAQTFEARQQVNFKQASFLRNGARALHFEETVASHAGEQGQIEIPREFTLGVEPYLGSVRAIVTARLRYRIREGRLSIGYQLVRPADVLRDAFREALDVVEQRTSLQAFMGTPPERP